jgi:hypothetical protein
MSLSSISSSPSDTPKSSSPLWGRGEWFDNPCHTTNVTSSP